MSIFQMLTPLTYWLLVVMWVYILGFLLRRLRSAHFERNLINTLVIILAINAFRTLFESVYFGASHSSRLGFLPIEVYEFLIRPEIVIIPKLMNLVAAALIIGILLYRWFPAEKRDRERLENTIKDRSIQLEKRNEQLRCEIVERKQATEKMRCSEEDLFITLNSIGDAVIAVDIDARVTRMNPSAEALTGWTIAEALGRPMGDVFNIINAQTRDKASNPVKRALREGSVIGLANHTVLIARDGKEFQIADSASPIRTAEGEIRGAVLVFSDVTEKYKKEQQLRDSEARFRGMFDSMSSGVAIYQAVDDGSDFVVVDFNPAAERIEKISREKVIGKRLLTTFPSVAEMGIFEMFQRVWRTGEPEHSPVAFYKDGRIEGWRENHIYRLPSGEVVAVYDDRTEQKRAELERERAYAFLQTVIDSFPGSLMVINRDYTVELANRTAKEILENVGSASSAWKCYSISHGLQVPCNSKEHLCPMEEVFKTKGVVTLEHIHADATGQDVPVEVVAAPIFDENGEMTQIIEMSFDITLHNQIAAEKDRLMAAIEQAAETIVITDVDANIEYVNPTFERITGYSSEEAIGQNPRILQSGEQCKAFYKEMWETLLHGEVWSGQFINKKKDGEFYTEKATISPVRDASGRTVNYVAVKRDVTEEIKLEEQLRQAQKMESIGQLVAGIAHDFNNLLQIINGYTQMAQMQLEPGHSAAAGLIEVSKAGNRARDLVKQLLTFSRQQVIDPVELDLNAEIASTQEMLRHMIGEHIRFEFIAGKNLGIVFADRGQLQQVLMNLGINARDAMSGGGKLTLKTENVLIGTEDLTAYGLTRPGQYVLLSVRDTGCGMDKEICKKIFDPFFTTKEVGKGTGLGLSTVYGIVKQNNGHISVYSEPGKGTTFHIYLPVGDVLSGDAENAPTEGANVAGGTGETLLVVEDDETILGLANQILSSFGYTVLTAQNGEEAVRLFEEHANEIDLVMMDVVMPRMGGKEAMEKILKIRPTLRHLFVSGYSPDAGHTRFIKKEGLNFLTKPYRTDTLLKKIRDVLDEPIKK